MGSKVRMNLVSNLDILRAKTLKQTLPLRFLRNLVFSRSSRILALALLTLFFYLGVSLLFPMWVLLIGPILWGVPHLISSLRYSTINFGETQLRKRLIFFQSGVWILVFAYRLGVDLFNLELIGFQFPLLFESVCLVFSFVFQIYLSRRFDLKWAIYFSLFAGLILVTHRFPVQTALFLLIGHNYVPLINWYQSGQNRKDIQVFCIVTILYVILSILIFKGGFQFLFKYIEPQGVIGLMDWSFTDIFSPYGAALADSAFWYRITCLYAFSQSIHYFLWMKAIPENYQSQPYPPSFKWSFNHLNQDFGSGAIYVFLLMTVMGLGYWLFFEYQTARLVYFAIASYHGFMEISALPFLTSNRRS